MAHRLLSFTSAIRLTADVEAELAADLEQYLSEPGSFTAALEFLHAASRPPGRSTRIISRRAATRSTNDPGEIEMHLVRDKKTGKLASPIQTTTSGSGNFEMTFDRNATNGRIDRVSIKPRNDG